MTRCFIAAAQAVLSTSLVLYFSLLYCNLLSRGRAAVEVCKCMSHIVKCWFSRRPFPAVNDQSPVCDATHQEVDNLSVFAARLCAV